jgi:hypothetical protein
MAIYTYKVYQLPDLTYRKLFWNTDFHQAYENILGGALPVSYNDNTIIDVYQKSATQVAIVIYSSVYNSSNLKIVSVTSGDTNNTLIFKRCNTGDSPPTFEFGIWSNVAKELTVFSYPLTQAPFCSAYAIDEETVINQSCIGTTLRRIYYDGDGGITTEDTPNSPICGYVAPVPEVVITETKRIKIDNTCYDNPIYLVWKNTLGGWDSWMFQKNQTRNLIVGDLGNFEQPEYTLENQENFIPGGNNSLGASADNTLILGANNLTTNQYNAIKELLYAPVVYWVQPDSSLDDITLFTYQDFGFSRTKVKAKAGTFSTETRGGFHSIEFEIELPKTNTVRS